MVPDEDATVVDRDPRGARFTASTLGGSGAPSPCVTPPLTSMRGTVTGRGAIRLPGGRIRRARLPGGGRSHCGAVAAVAGRGFGFRGWEGDRYQRLRQLENRP
jgi:hypothetical protein